MPKTRQLIRAIPSIARRTAQTLVRRVRGGIGRVARVVAPIASRLSLPQTPTVEKQPDVSQGLLENQTEANKLE
jgi:hypothetical protein